MSRVWPSPRDDAADYRETGIPTAEVQAANALMRKLGCTTRYRLDGSPYQLAPGERDAWDPAEGADNG